MSLNKVMLIGNVGNDPEIRYLDQNSQNGSNAKVASFRLATTERFRDRNGETRENTEWHNIVTWRNNADVVERFVKKGTQLYIEGRIRTRSWTDQTGNKRYTTEINADNLQLLGKRPDGDGSQPYGGQPGYGAAPTQTGYGNAPAQTGYPNAPAQSGYSDAPVPPSFGPGPQAPAYGPAPQAPAYGPAPQQPTSFQPAAPEEDAPSDDLPF